jgi:hypothetical protein
MEQIERDMARQRQLERCKWVFWRVSASSFYFDREKAMASLWRKLVELGIQPVKEAPTIPSSEAPLQPERASAPRNSVPPNPRVGPRLPAPSRQPDLIPSNQMELPSTTNDISSVRSKEATCQDDISVTLQEYIAAAKRKRPHGVLIYEEIGYVVLELMPRHGRVGRKEIIRKAANALDFPEVAYKRIDESIRWLEEQKKVSTDPNFVWRRLI